VASDPVAHLRNAHQQAEQLARAATSGPWFANAHDWGDHDFAANIGTAATGYDTANVVGHGHEGGGVVELADATFIATNHPGAALRRIEAERELLAEHAEGWRHCEVCSEEDYDGAGRVFRRPLPWPCPTILAVARGWGWTEEQQHG
jgi:hypothetical protein